MSFNHISHASLSSGGEVHLTNRSPVERYHRYQFASQFQLMSTSQAQEPKLYSSFVWGDLLMREATLHQQDFHVQLGVGDKLAGLLSFQLENRLVAALALQLEDRLVVMTIQLLAFFPL